MPGATKHQGVHQDRVPSAGHGRRVQVHQQLQLLHRLAQHSWANTEKRVQHQTIFACMNVLCKLWRCVLYCVDCREQAKHATLTSSVIAVDQDALVVPGERRLFNVTAQQLDCIVADKGQVGWGCYDHISSATCNAAARTWLLDCWDCMFWAQPIDNLLLHRLCNPTLVDLPADGDECI